MSDRTPAETPEALPVRLRRRQRMARVVLLVEQLWPALWPPLGLLGAFLCLALLDVPAWLPPPVHMLLLAALAAGVAGLGWRHLRSVRLPDGAAVNRRLERASGLHHRPLTALVDRPALLGAEALWHAHQARAAAQVGRLRVGLPRPGLAAIDRRALRNGLLLALIACFVIAGTEAPERVLRAFRPSFAIPPPPPAPALQVWITPPSYTNMAPVFLRPDGGAVSVPAGSHLTVSLSGGRGKPQVTLAGRLLPVQPLDAMSVQADEELTGGGRLIVRRGSTELGAWDVTVVADTAPTVAWPEPPGAAPSTGPITGTRLPWEVSHAYGVVALHAELRLKDRPEAPPLIVAIPLPGGTPKHAKGIRVQDLTAHPWAGLPVIARLVARDAPGLVGHSAEAGFILPERRFDNPLARAIIAVRKQLSLRPDQRAPAIAELDRLSEMDSAWRDDLGGYLNLRAAGEQLLYDRDPAAVEEVQGRLWQLALHLEEGLTEKTARKLDEVRQALRDAIEAQHRGETLDPREIDRRIQALERAIENHLQALAEQLRRDPDAEMADPDAQRLDAQEAEKLAEQMRQAVEQGRMADAQRQMAELDRLLDALQRAKPIHRDAQARQRADKRARGRQQLTAMQDMVQREAKLLDHAQARQSDPAADGSGEKENERRHDEEMQKALRRALGEVMQQYGDLMGQVPSPLTEADQAMRDAARALGDARDGPAAQAMQQAIAALQKGGDEMSQAMAQAFGMPGQQGESQDGGEGQPGLAYGNPQDGDPTSPGGGERPWRGQPRFGRHGDQRFDPLGRPLKEGTRGTDESSDITVPEQMEQARTRVIQEELRRRGGERGRPQQELDYIDRLLREF